MTEKNRQLMARVRQTERECGLCAPIDQDPDTVCEAVDPRTHYYRCSRVKGHDGDHVACGLTKHRLATWKEVLP